MRWSGPFPTPNVAGMETALGLIIVVILYLWTEKQGKWHTTWTKSGLFILGTCLCFCLFSTGSRAGTLSAVCSLAVLCFSKILSARRTVVALCLLALFVAISPFSQRFISVPTGDASIWARIELWRSTVNLMADYPLCGVGIDDLIPILERWYLPTEYHGKFATALNEPLTIGAAWGIPAMVMFFALICALLSLGIQKARLGFLWATIGTCFILVHFISGLFQGNLFAGWWFVHWGYIIGSVLILLGGVPRGALWRMVHHCLALLFALGALASALYCGVNGPWATRRIDGVVLAYPRNYRPDRMIISVNPSSAPASMLQDWCERQLRAKSAVMLPETMPNASWWSTVRAICAAQKIDLICFANGAQAVLAWKCGVDGKLGDTRLILCDPNPLPSGSAIRGNQMRISIILGRNSLSREAINKNRKGDCEIYDVDSSGISWWDEQASIIAQLPDR